jgi:hypothetical protein
MGAAWYGAGSGSGAGRALAEVAYPADGVHQARVQHVGADIRREVELLDVAQGVEPAPAGLVEVSEQAVLPQDGGEVGGLLEVQVRHLLEGLEVAAGEPVDADHPDEGADVLLDAADIGLGAREQFGVVVQGSVLRHQVGGDLVGALRELGVAEPLGAALHHRLEGRPRQAVAAGLLAPQDLLA